MKKMILIMAMVLATAVPALAQDFSVDVTDSISQVTETPLTVEQHIQSIDSVLQCISAKMVSMEYSGNSHMNGFNFGQMGKEVLVPIIAIVFSFGMPIVIVLLILLFKHKNKKAQCALAAKALEAGKDIPEGLFYKEELREGNSLMAKGIKNLFLGLGLGIFLWAITDEFGLGCIGFMIMFIGLGQIVIHKIQNPSPEPFIRMNKDEKTGESFLKVGGIELKHKEKTEQNSTEE